MVQNLLFNFAELNRTFCEISEIEIKIFEIKPEIIISLPFC